jgi:AAA15 family ATPase/GTPase
MIKSIKIANFKSVVDLSLELGRFNVLIGENGCGKSNILEALAFGAAASADKLDNEFLGSRGIRVTNPDFMFSAFSDIKKNKSIDIRFDNSSKIYNYSLANEQGMPKKWYNENKKIVKELIDRIFKTLIFEEDETKKKELIAELSSKELPVVFSKLSTIESKRELNDIISNLYPTIIDETFSHPDISNYIVYSPEQSYLRKFEESNQIYPLGIKGEGLFQYLKELSFDEKNRKILKEIKENLALLDWYEDFEIPENLIKNEFSLNIKDRYLDTNLHYFDQRSTNEGFLYLLFYSTLFTSENTPAFFAIDNIEASFNPKLCTKLIQTLATLAKKKNKQVIVTTHNLAVLDGLNLEDHDQRLFVVNRNMDGHTKARRITYKADRTISLSDAWRKGLIGGLPDNF